MLALRGLFLLSGAILGVFYPFVPVILAGRGFDPGAIGLVTAVSSLGFTLAMPVWGHLADVELGRARALRIAIIGSTVAVLGLLAPLPPGLIGTLVVAYGLFECAFAPLSDALAVNALDASPRAYGRVRLLASLGFSVATIAAGRLYDDTGYGPAPLLWAVLGVLMVASSLGVPDVARLGAHVARPRTGRRAPGLGSFGLALRIQPRLAPILLALTLIHIGIISGFTFLALRLLDLGAPPSDIALSAGVSALAEVPAMALVPRLVGRLGVRLVLPAAILLYGACIASWAFLAEPGLIIATRVGTGLAFAGVTVSAVITVGQLLPRELQGTGQALYQTVGFGASAVIANSLGGLVYSTAGPTPLFLGGAALAAIGSVVAFVSLPRRGESFARATLPAEVVSSVDRRAAVDPDTCDQEVMRLAPSSRPKGGRGSGPSPG